MPSPVLPEDSLENLELALSLLEQRDAKQLTTYLHSLHPVELVTLLQHATTEAQTQLLQHIAGLDHLSAVVAYANEPLRELSLQLIDDSRIAAILRRQELDDAADILSDLPRRRQLRVLKRLSPERVRAIRSLLAYDQDRAGRLMTPSFLTFSPHTSVAEAIEHLLHNLRQGELDERTALQYGYVVDADRTLLGVCSLRELLSADPQRTVLDISEREIIVVSPEDDQEKVARIIADYDLSALPVCTESNGEILGIVTVDDVLDILEEEHTEDLFRLVGIEEQAPGNDRLRAAVRSRVPWLAASWCGGVMGAMLLGSYSSTLERVVALAFFMPVVFGMGGNVGSQSSTITVRGLATGELNDRQILRRVKRESAVGAMLGLVFGVLLFAAAFVLYRELRLSTVIAVSIFCTMSLAATLGALLPILFKRLGIDPAVASGPLVTTGTDILSIAIYFSIASALL